MNSFYKTAGILFLLIMSVAPLSAQESDQDRIQACYDTYRSAVLAGEGKKALSQVSRNTVSYYQTLRDNAAWLDSTEVRALGLADQMSVLLIRQKLSPEKLAKMDGYDVSQFAIDQGLIDKAEAQKQSIANIRVTGESAKAQMLILGNPTPIDFDFRIEEGSWRLDMSSMLEMANEVVEQMAAEYGNDEEFIAEILYILAEGNVKEGIWHPMLPKE